jgi:hypothetical protein
MYHTKRSLRKSNARNPYTDRHDLVFEHVRFDPSLLTAEQILADREAARAQGGRV